MNRQENSVAVFGASGHTGSFVVKELHRRGLGAIRIGRNMEKLQAQTDPAWGDPARVATIEDTGSLDAALEGACAVINCAGPFLDTALPVLDAALRARIPYLDVAAEQAAVRSIFDTRHRAAVAAGVPVVPAMAFYGGLADLMASALAQEDEVIDQIEVAIGLDSWHPTLGTRLTGQRNNVPRVILKSGRFELLSSPPHRSGWDFPEPIGRREVVALPFTEVVTMASHMKVDTISSWLNVESLDDLHNASTPAPELNEETGRSDQRFAMDVVVGVGAEKRMARAQGSDIYQFSAPLAVGAAMRLLSGDARHREGVHASGAMFDARAFLNDLGAAGLEIAYGSRP